MSKNKIVLISGEEGASKATILVGGIHDNYTHFNFWAQDLGVNEELLVGFNHDHQSSTMKAAGRELADAILALKDAGVEEITVVAHSMGGLVSRAALNELVRSGDAQDFKSIELHALGTPWGGFALSSIPGSNVFGPLVGYPMAREMSPGSSFMHSLTNVEWPENMSFHVYQGTADNVSLPSVLATHERYDAIGSTADTAEILPGYGHSDYVNAGVYVLSGHSEALAAGPQPSLGAEGEEEPARAREQVSGSEQVASKEPEVEIEME